MNNDMTTRLLCFQPRIELIDHFLTSEECQHIQELAVPALAVSTVVDNDTGESVLFESRTSRGMFLQRTQDTTIQRIEYRISAYLDIPVEHQEPLQVLRYGPTHQYTPHYDYFDPTLSGAAKHLERGGQRIATMILYLNDVEAGGDTSFPAVGIRVIPKAGRALVFYNCGQNQKPDPDTLHAGDPVISGEKWIATCWIRQNEFI